MKSTRENDLERKEPDREPHPFSDRRVGVAWSAFAAFARGCDKQDYLLGDQWRADLGEVSNDFEEACDEGGSGAGSSSQRQTRTGRPEVPFKSIRKRQGEPYFTASIW